MSLTNIKYALNPYKTLIFVNTFLSSYKPYHHSQPSTLAPLKAFNAWCSLLLSHCGCLFLALPLYFDQL